MLTFESCVCSLRVVLAAFFVALPVSMMSAQQAPESRQHAEPSGTLRVTTRLVVLNVVAVDMRGKPITDLRQGDFTLLEDGKEQEIRVFQLQQPSRRPLGATTDAMLPANVFTNVSQFQDPDTRNIIVLDTLHTSFEDQTIARDQIIRYLERIPQNQPLGIFELTSQGRIEMAQDFTVDRGMLIQAAKNLKTGIPLLGGRPIVQRFPVEVQRSIGDAVLARERQSFHDFSATVSSYPGRKNVIWFSDSWPAPMVSNSKLIRSTFEMMPDALVDSSIAVYPVEPRGLTLDEAFSDFSRPLPADPENYRASVVSASFASAPSHDHMDKVARLTGGRPCYYHNDLDGCISRAIYDGSSYYSVGYYPDRKSWNGAFRKIHIQVNRPDITLRYRAGYAAFDPEEQAVQSARLAGDLRRAMSLDTPTETTIAFQAEVLPPSAETQNKVVIRYAIRPQAITFQSGEDGLEHASIECVAQPYTAKGKTIMGKSSTIEESLKPETFQLIAQNGLSCTQEIDLPAGTYLLKLAVRDNRTAGIGTVSAKVTVPELPANTPPAPAPQH